MTLLHGVVYHNLNHSSLVVKGRMRLRIEEGEWRRMHESSRVE